MECCLKFSKPITLTSSLSSSSVPCSKHSILRKSICYGRNNSSVKMEAVNGAPHPPSSSNTVGDMNRRLSSLESLFCYDKAIPEEIIEKPVGLSLGEKNIGNKTRCPGCEAKGAVLCATCSGSGLYVDSIMESQGIIVKVRCLDLGGMSTILDHGRGWDNCAAALQVVEEQVTSCAQNVVVAGIVELPNNIWLLDLHYF